MDDIYQCRGLYDVNAIIDRMDEIDHQIEESNGDSQEEKERRIKLAYAKMLQAIRLQCSPYGKTL